MTHNLAPAALLAQTGWLKGLARGLVVDDASADDVVQQTWLRALERPPREPKALPAWLAAVARNEARQTGRSEGARTRRQRRVARPEASVGPVDDVVARAELHEELVRRVLALPEPQKTTVLLRYFEGLEPSAIARRLDVPAGTVRSRLKRGLDTLRTELDAECGGDRRAWVAVLLPWARSPRTTSTTVGATAVGALAMSAKTKASVGLILLLLVGGIVAWAVWGDRDAPNADTVIADHDVPEPVLRGRTEEPIAPPPPPADDSDASAEPTPVAAPAGPQALLTFVDETGRPWTAEELQEVFRTAGVEPRLTFVRQSQLRQEGLVGLLATLFGPADAWQATVDLAWSDGGASAVPPEADEWRLYLSRPGATPYLSEAHPFVDGEAIALEVPLPRQPRRVTVRILEASTGEPLVGARVTPYHEVGDDSAFLPGTTLTADAGGEVALPVYVATQSGQSRGPTWWIETDTHARRLSSHHLARHEDDGAPLEYAVHPTGSVTGHAWTSEGKPAVGLEVLWARKGRVRRTTVAADGTYTLTGIALSSRPEDGSEDIALWEDPARGIVHVGSAPVRAGEMTEADIGKPASSDQAAIVGRITAGQRPLEGVFVVARDGPGEGKMAQTDANGDYRIPGLEEGEAQLQVYFGDPRVVDDFTARTIQPFELPAGSKTRRDFSLPDGAILLTLVREEDGEPIAGGVGLARPADRELEARRFDGFHYSAGWGGRTAEDGTILLLGLVPDHPHVLMAGGDGYERTTQEEILPGTVAEPARVTVRLTTTSE